MHSSRDLFSTPVRPALRRGVRRGRSFAFSVLAIALLQLGACRVFFSRPAESWLDPAWLDRSRVVEVQLRYDTRLSWNPLNQDSIGSAYESRLFLQAVKQTSARPAPALEFARYDGWTLNGSVYAFAGCVLAIRGAGDSLERPGGPEREAPCWPLPPGQSTDNDSDKSVPVLRPSSGEYLLAAIPAPGAAAATRDSQADALLAVFLTRSTLELRHEELILDFYRLDGRGSGARFQKISRRIVPWRGDPGMPDVAWSRKGGRVFIKRMDDVVETTGDLSVPLAGTDGYRIASRFPRCFRGTDSGGPVSPDGLVFVPQPAGSVPDDSAGGPGPQTGRGFRLESAPAWRNFQNTDLIAEFRRIGYGCQ